MKILLVITKSEIGGAQVFVLNLARSLQNRGYDVEVAAGDGNYLFGELQKEKIPFHYLNSLKRNISIMKSFYFLYDLYRLLKINNYDIVHLNSSNTLIGGISTFFIRKRPKTIFTFHGLSFIDKNYKTRFYIKFLAKMYFKVFLHTVDKTVFVSSNNYEELKEAKIIKSGEVIINGLDEVNMHFFSEKDARDYFSRKCNLDLTKNFLIGSTGRLAYQKNYEFLIKNFTVIKDRIPKVKAIIIGDGPYYEKYKRQISEFGLENDLFFVGSIKDSYRYIKAFDVFTLLSRYEGLSISLIEAVIAGIPILASRVGGNPENVGNCTQQLFNLDDSEDYISKLLNICKNKKKISEFNSSLLEKFSLNNMTSRYIKLYDDLSMS